MTHGRALAFALLTSLSATVDAQQPSRANGVDSLLQAIMETGQVAGMVVGVVVDDDTVLLRGYGHADRETNLAMPVDAVLQIASLTKQFTAAAILKLRDEGRLSLDDDLSTFLPDYPLHGRRVSIARLLDHTSGIRSYTDTPWFPPLSQKGLPRDSLIARFASEPVDFEPGTAMIYNNSGYVLLGLIIERVSGMAFDEYVTQHLLRPAGVTRTRFCGEAPATARGHLMTPDSLIPVAGAAHLWPSADGSLCSTAGDLIAWTRALHGGRVLPPATLQEMLTPRPLLDGTVPQYAKGLTQLNLEGHRSITHGGALPGFQADLHYLPAQRATIVVLMNTSGPVQPGGVAAQVAKHLFGVGSASPPTRVFTCDLDPFVGTFQGRTRGGTLTLRTSVRDSALYVQNGNSPNASRVLYIGDNAFRTTAGTTTLQFIMEDGRAIRIVQKNHVGVLMLRRVDD